METAVVQYEVLFCHLAGGLWKTKKFRLGLPQFRTSYLPNACQKLGTAYSGEKFQKLKKKKS
jgi:hypothetical protein